MKHNFKWKLFTTMMFFALIISFTLAITNYNLHQSDAIANEERMVQEKINFISHNLETSERANLFIGDNISEQLEYVMESLQAFYLDHPNIAQWNFDEITENYNVDLYIINDENVIIHSNVSQDLGLNFNQCCSKLAKILDERRESGLFFIDGFDIEQATGNIKSYSYMATPDKKYMIQLGFNWNRYPLFEQFNFLNTLNQVKDSDELIKDVHLLNIGGLAYGKTEEQFSLTDQGRQAFERTLRTGENSSFESIWNGEPVTYNYSLYVSEEDHGSSQTKVIELVYSKTVLNAKLNQYQQAFIWQITLILLVTIILALIISRWVGKPIYMAFHDQLTSVGNRAYFEEYLNKSFLNNKKPFTILMIDLDNFKQVNDTYGHDIGDKLLRLTSRLMQDAILKNERIFRLGGDEFIIVIPTEDMERARELAKTLLSLFKAKVSSNYTLNPPVSLSIGISGSAGQFDDLDTIMRRVDQALYISKRSGKNKYSV